jgi:hypothetical protein
MYITSKKVVNKNLKMEKGWLLATPLFYFNFFKKNNNNNNKFLSIIYLYF